jgi:hypothetical protein
MCLRLSLAQAHERNVKGAVDDLLAFLRAEPSDVDCVLDLGAPAGFELIDGFAKLLFSVVGGLPYRDDWRTLTLMGTSFPEALQPGAQVVRRYEWIVYKRLAQRLSEAKVRVPTFGDYGIVHPKVVRMDMRLVKPSATVRYTIADAWYVVRGQNVRDHGYAQYRDLCNDVTSSRYFTRRVSEGDVYIAECAAGGATGNLTTWVRVGTNRHIETVASDIANLFGS